jgi:hypothetical protein
MMPQITTLHASASDKPTPKGLTFGALAAALLLATPVVAQDDGWSYAMKPPPPGRVFKAPMDVLAYVNMLPTARDAKTAIITTDGEGNATVDIIFSVPASTNAVMASFNTQYALKAVKGGWSVTSARYRWKCRLGPDTESWQSKEGACPSSKQN